MKKVLIICPSNEDLINMKHIIDESKNRFHFTFFDLRNFHHNKMEYPTSKINLINSRLKIKKPFYLLGPWSKLKAIIFFNIEINKMKLNYDVVLSGTVGILEYLIINAIKRNYETKSFSVVDSVVIYHEQNSIFKKLRMFIYGFKVRQNICDKIFVSGQISKNTLEKDGVNKEKIIISGLPRMSKYFDSDIKKSNSDKNVLILTGAHKWNGYSNWQKDQEDFLYKINTICNESFNISVKPHPRDNFDFNKLNKLNILSSKSNIDEEIKKNDIIVCATSISTALIQAGWMNKKILFIKTRSLSNKMDSFKYFITNFQTIKLKEVDKNSFNFAKVPQKKLLEKFISKKSKKSALSIINEIEKNIMGNV